MKIVYLENGRFNEREFRFMTESLNEMHAIGEVYLSEALNSKKITSDGDGVLWHDDLAVLMLKTIAGQEACDMFSKVADLNIKAVKENGKPPYCWYAPTVFAGQLLNGLSIEVNRVVGKYATLMPGVERFISCMEGFGIEIATVSGAHQEAADVASRRCGIPRVIGTQLSVANEVYGVGVERFIGGEYKLKAVKKILGLKEGEQGTHHGDGWSDYETLADGNMQSIAFNPTSIELLMAAPIVVIGISYLGLLPFYDINGEYDLALRDYELPWIIIENPERSSFEGDKGKLEELLNKSKGAKLKLKQILFGTTEKNLEKLVEKIRKELEKRGIRHQTNTKDFMPLEEFDRYAKKLYDDFVNR